jgi:1-deoxy-D-xylulose-5-phosphate reductoisomerase
MDQVQVVVHPQSIIHSMVRFRDGSVLGQLGWPDMRLPIAYSLLYPERLPNPLPTWNPVDTPNLTFESVDEETFGSIRLARAAVDNGGTMPCAMNAANEESANAFLRNEIRFLQIPEIVEKTMTRHRVESPTLENLLRTDAFAREFSRSLILSA